MYVLCTYYLTEHLIPLLHRRLLLRRGRLASRLPDDHLGRELPVRINDILPRRLDLVINGRVIMLHVDAQAFGLQRRPQHQLMHATALLAPRGEFVRVALEPQQRLVRRRVLEEQHRRVPAALEPGQLGFCRGRALRVAGHVRHDGSLDDVPQLLVLLAQQDDDARGLRVEGVGRHEKRLSHDLFEFAVRDGGLGREVVDGAPLGGEGEIFVRAGHFGAVAFELLLCAKGFQRRLCGLRLCYALSRKNQRDFEGGLCEFQVV